MRSARSGCERPEKTISRFCGPRSIQWPGFGSVTVSTDSKPGRTSSVVPVTGCIPLLVLLPRAGDGERVRRDVLRDHGSSGSPCTVSDLDRGDEAILDPGPDVPPDSGPTLRPACLMGKIRGDGPGTHVRVVSDLRVADVREVRHFRPYPDARVLDLHEGSRLGTRLEDRPGAKVTERPDDRAAADLGVDGDRVREDLGPRPDPGAAAKVGPGVNRRVGLELDARLDPRRDGIDDRRAGEHVPLVDPVAQHGRGSRKLDARVHALDLERIGGEMSGDDLTVVREIAHGVGEVQLALRVLRLE